MPGSVLDARPACCPSVYPQCLVKCCRILSQAQPKAKAKAKGAKAAQPAQPAQPDANADTVSLKSLKSDGQKRKLPSDSSRGKKGKDVPKACLICQRAPEAGWAGSRSCTVGSSYDSYDSCSARPQPPHGPAC